MAFTKYWDLAFALRSGTEARNAAYGMTDLDDTGYNLLQVMQWVHDDTRHPALTPIWNARLQNSVCVIAGLSGATMNLLIVSRGLPTAERYTADGPCAVGDRKTFKKNNRLPPDSVILDEHEFPSSLEGVTEALAWIHATVGR
jgi:hypothetical protein